VLAAPFIAGLLAFLFQLYINQKPLIELYSKSHPYRKLKPYGVISTFLAFEFVLVWGMYTKQILLLNTDLFLITVIFIGAIVYYHLFIRMKVSLRFLVFAIFIPPIAYGAAVGLGSYFKILQFIVPSKRIGDIVFFNTLYWIIYNILLQVVCEEPAFRGYLMQRLLRKGETSAIVYSSLCYAIWRTSFSSFAKLGWDGIVVEFCGNFIMGIIFALLFIKGRNLLIAIICHGLIDGLYISLSASSANPGVRQYIDFLISDGEHQLKFLWITCLFIGLVLLTFIPRKKIYGR
jgi:membrane protease YdiL (CAAX protease family)